MDDDTLCCILFAIAIATIIVVVDWRGLKSGPDVGEYATFDGLVYRHPSATE